MKILKRVSSGLAFAAFMTTSAAAMDPVELKIASFKQGSSYYIYAVTIGDLLRTHLPKGSVIDTPPIGGGVANPALVSSGKADLGLSFSVSNTWASKGDIAFKNPVSNVRALVGGLDQYYVAILSNGKNGSNSVGSYLSKVKPDAQVIMLPKGSTGYYASHQLLGITNASEDQLSARGGKYNYGSFGVVKSSFANKSANLFAHVVTIGHPAVTDIALNNDITFLEPSDTTLKAMGTKYGWDTATLPAKSFKNQDKALRLPATNTVLIARADMSDELAYMITKTICENAKKLAAGHKALARFDPKTRAWLPELTGIELHPGAVRYYREQGWL